MTRNYKLTTARFILYCFFVVSLFFASCIAFGASYKVGSGIHDITGTPAERGMLGYGSLSQVTQGIYTRLRSRAFVIEDPDRDRRVAIVIVDLGLMFDSIKSDVLKKLEKEFPGKYTDDNVMISATHTHSGPGGFSHHDMFNVTTKGFDQSNFDVISNGVFESIRKAHLNLDFGSIIFHEGKLLGASGNRSIAAYHQNTDWKEFETEIDPTNILLRFIQTKNTSQNKFLTINDIGILDWFAVHATCMSNTNKLISSDNKGRAAELFEREMGTKYQDSKTFVAAFANASEGDSSPLFADDPTGARKPGAEAEFELTEKSGDKQYYKAKELFEQDGKILPLYINYKKVWVNMPEFTVSPEFVFGKLHGTSQKLCHASLGYSFAAGAIDGPSGVPGLYQGMRQNEAIVPPPLEVLATFVRLALGGSDQGKECQYPKVILLSTSDKNPDLIPETLPVQLFVVGSLAIAGIPGEITTMAGRRLKKILLEELSPIGVDTVTVSAISNDYAGYITTYEEYGYQNYEGGFTVFGPHTHGAYLQIFKQLALSIKEDKNLEINPHRAVRVGSLRDFLASPSSDEKNLGESFGDVLKRPKSSYSQGDVVSVDFRAGHPNHNMKKQENFLEVQKFENNQWVAVMYDWDSDTRFHWGYARSRDCTNCSTANVRWKITGKTPVGVYRILHRGYYRSLGDDQLVKYEGVTSQFTVR